MFSAFSWNTFLRFFVILKKEVTNFWFFLKMVFMVVVAFFIWVFQVFPNVKSTVSILKPPLLIFIVGYYFTSFPLYIVIILSFFPIQYIFPLLFVGFIALFAL